MVGHFPISHYQLLSCSSNLHMIRKPAPAGRPMPGSVRSELSIKVWFGERKKKKRRASSWMCGYLCRNCTACPSDFFAIFLTIFSPFSISWAKLLSVYSFFSLLRFHCLQLQFQMIISEFATRGSRRWRNYSGKEGRNKPWEAQGFAAAVPPLSLLKDDESSGAEW